MVSRSQKIRLGIFVVVSIFALLLTLLLTVAPKFFEKRDVYYIGYRNISVSGLQEGGPVKYHGLSVGYVSNIKIDPKDIRRVIVEISLDHGTPIKKDTYADITAMGITGLMLIELRSGSNESENLETGGFIVPGRSFNELITGRAETIVEKVEILLNNMNDLTTQDKRDKILVMMDNFSKAMDEIFHMLHDNKHVLNRTLEKADTLTTELVLLTNQANETLASLNAVLGSDSLKAIVDNVAQITDAMNQVEYGEIMTEMNQALEHMNSILKNLDAGLSQNRNGIKNSIDALKESVEYLNEFSRIISEDPSVLIRGAKPQNAPDFDLEK